MRLGDCLLCEFVTKAVLGDRDHRKTARRERIAEDGIDPGGHLGRAARGFGKNKVAGPRILQVRNLQFAAIALVDRGQIVAIALLAYHAED